MSRRSIGRSIVFAIVSLIGSSIAQRSVAAPADSPWLLPENAAKYIFIGKDVWDIDAGKVAAPNAAPDVFETSHRIAGVSDRIFDAPPSGPHPSGIVSPGRIVMLDGSMPQMPTLDGKQTDSTGNGPAFWINADRRRVVWMQNGDYWRGEIDWKNSSIINRKQVTSLGVFTPLTSPILWWGQLLFVDGEFDKAKPIVRIDLASGDITEMETQRVFLVNTQQGRTLATVVSPSGARIINPTPSVIFCYDVRTGKATMFRNKFEDTAALRSQTLFVNDPPIWIDDDTVYSLDARGYLAKLDLRNSRMEILQEPQMILNGETPTHTRNLAVLPGTHLVDQSTSSGGGHGGPATVGQRSLLNVADQKRTSLPFDDSMSGKWIDATKYIYVQTKGGLSTVGTWLYDRSDNSNKHLSSFSIDFFRMVMVPERKQIYAVSQQSGNQFIRLNLDGSPSQNLGPCALAVVHRMPAVDDVVDLGFTGQAVDLWKPVAVDEAALAATEPAEPPQGKLKLFDLTKDLSGDDKAFAEQAYDYCIMNSTLGVYCDATKAAMKVLDAYRSQPNQPVGSFFAMADFSDCVDRDHLARWGHDHALETIANDQQMSADQKRQVADQTGRLLADAYYSQAKPDIRKVDMLFQTSLADARKGSGSNSSPAAAATSMPPAAQQNSGAPAPAPAPAPSSPQQTSPPQQNSPAASEIDKAAEEAKKAKDAAHRLKGLFGH